MCFQFAMMAVAKCILAQVWRFSATFLGELSSFHSQLGVSFWNVVALPHPTPIVRQVARERRRERFTALLHHLNVDLLRESFYASDLPKKAGIIAAWRRSPNFFGTSDTRSVLCAEALPWQLRRSQHWHWALAPIPRSSAYCSSDCRCADWLPSIYSEFVLQDLRIS